MPSSTEKPTLLNGLPPTNGDSAHDMPHIDTTQEVCTFSLSYMYQLFPIENVIIIIDSLLYVQLLMWFDEMSCEVQRDQDRVYRLAGQE